MPASSNVLEIKNLRVSFFTEAGEVRAVNDVSFEIPRGKVLALVGESGCGKSVTSYSILRLIQKPGRIVGGEIRFNAQDGTSVDLVSLAENDKSLRDLRGNLIAMIFQEPMTALSMVHTIGNQLGEVLTLHGKLPRAEVKRRVVAMLEKVGIPGAERRYAQYPFELSGGMRQRVVIAMAMLSEPELLIADEPTTALDVTIQAQILELMDKLRRELGSSVLLITHDLAVVAETADRVAVMYAGRIVETGSVYEIIKQPRHPYTRGLLASVPSVANRRERLSSISGAVPSLSDLPAGCSFHPRCPYAQHGLCDQELPPEIEEIAPGHTACCFRVKELEPDFRREDSAK